MNVYIVLLIVLQLTVASSGKKPCRHHHRHSSESGSSSSSSESESRESIETTQTTEESTTTETPQITTTDTIVNTTQEAPAMNVSWYEMNKNLVETHNQGNYTYKLKLNMFANYSLSALSSKYLGLRMPKLAISSRNLAPKVAKSSKKSTLPTTIDWRTQRQYAYDTGVKQQGSCGSCWAWATIGTVEFALLRKTGKLNELSVQNLVDCSDNGGCDGGWLTTAYDYMIDNGVNLASDYPYKDDESRCRFSSRKSVYSVKSYARVDKDDYEVSNVLAFTGPVAVGICATTNFLFYSEGVFNDEACNQSCEVNHAVILIGYGTDKKFGDYWLLKNSWGESWGENGYARVTKTSTRNCQITSWAYYPIV